MKSVACRVRRVVLWIGFVVACGVDGFGFDEAEEPLFNVTELGLINGYGVSAAGVGSPLMVGLTLIKGAAAKHGVCSDGSLPGYHFSPGFGSGSQSWLIVLEGGGWCNTIRNCVYRKTSRRGSSAYMEKALPFTGILSNNPRQNPDFYNWNRVKLRYCDGASFTGDSYDAVHQLHFRGQRIWSAAMDELMSKGMKYATQALLSGCSAGGLASILHCDDFSNLFSSKTKVKCLSDAGLFLDVVDVAGGRSLRNLYNGVVSLQGVQKSLPQTCTSRLDPTSCFFPQNVIANIRTPMFLVNAAYDTWQIKEGLAPNKADPHGYWKGCKKNYTTCSAPQIRILQRFRNQMLNAVKNFSVSSKNGLFINSCFAHCQTERQDTWFSENPPLIGNKGIAKAVGDWYFDREATKAIECAYPCGKTCHNLVSR